MQVNPFTKLIMKLRSILSDIFTSAMLAMKHLETQQQGWSMKILFILICKITNNVYFATNHSCLVRSYVVMFKECTIVLNVNFATKKFEGRIFTRSIFLHNTKSLNLVVINVLSLLRKRFVYWITKKDVTSNWLQIQMLYWIEMYKERSNAQHAI